MRFDPAVTYSLSKQLHREIELDSLRQIYSKMMVQLREINFNKLQQQFFLKDLQTTIEKLQQKKSALEDQLNLVVQQIQQAENKLRYETEYKQRQTYYRLILQQPLDLSQSSFHSIQSRGYKGVIVSPDGIPFQHERIQSLLSIMAHGGYLCFYFNSHASKDVEQVDEGLLQYNNEISLLRWVLANSCSPIVLCTWVLQAAWFDLLDSKSIWYDVCDREDVLFRKDDPGILLKHFEQVRQADLVSYSDTQMKKFVSLRKDAVCIPPKKETEFRDSLIGKWRGESAR